MGKNEITFPIMAMCVKELNVRVVSDTAVEIINSLWT
jgi:hypothetical protein